MTDNFEVINICKNYIIENDIDFESDEIYVKQKFEYIIIKDIKYKMWNIDRYYDNYKKYQIQKQQYQLKLNILKKINIK